MLILRRTREAFEPVQVLFSRNAVSTVQERSELLMMLALMIVERLMRPRVALLWLSVLLKTAVLFMMLPDVIFPSCDVIFSR